MAMNQFKPVQREGKKNAWDKIAQGLSMAKSAVDIYNTGSGMVSPAATNTGGTSMSGADINKAVQETQNRAMQSYGSLDSPMLRRRYYGGGHGY